MTLSTQLARAPARWMESMQDDLKNKTLLEITLPGTHDSGAYQLIPRLVAEAVDDIVDAADSIGLSVEHLIEEWSLTQRHTLYDQLMLGVRYFDFRAAWDAEDKFWRTNHGQIFGNPLIDLLEDIQRFMRETTKEVVLVEVNNIMGVRKVDQTELLVRMFEEELGEWMCPRGSGTAKPGSADFKTIGEMVADNKRLIITFEDADAIAKKPTFWYASAIHNTYAGTPKEKKMIAFNNAKVEEFQKGKSGPYSNTLFKLSWTLTPKLSTIIATELGGDGTLLDLVGTINPKLRPWWEEVKSKKHPYPVLGHILLVDDFSNCDALRVSYETSDAPPVGDPLPRALKSRACCFARGPPPVTPVERAPHTAAATDAELAKVKRHNADMRSGARGLKDYECSWDDDTVEGSKEEDDSTHYDSGDSHDTSGGSDDSDDDDSGGPRLKMSRQVVVA